jgi:bis(5'-nucleosyl)-tetraphosphatase (symmetrical)
MALYAIGDVQGCYESLRRLLDEIRFDSAKDRLWFTGDLVNRGPDSLDVLRFVADLGDRAVTVLGNHDLHLLAVAAGARPLTTADTFQDVLEAPDRDTLLAWLAGLPLLHHDPMTGFLLVHAGVLPQWDLPSAQAFAHEAESAIASGEFYAHMYGDAPERWSEKLSGWARTRLIVNAFTRLRFCYPDGRMDYAQKGLPGSQPAPLLPWFAVPHRKTRGTPIIFGHWSVLGRWTEDGVICLDTGCLWGRELTAVKLSDGPRIFFSVECRKPI